MSRRPLRWVTAAVAIGWLLTAAPASADADLHPGRLTVTPDRVDFGHQAVGSATNPVTITIHNSGTRPVTFNHLSIKTMRGEPGTFIELNGLLKAVLCDGDARTLRPEQSCLLFVQFTPVSPGQKHAGLEVFFTDSRQDHPGESDHDQRGADLDVNLRGTGVPPA